MNTDRMTAMEVAEAGGAKRRPATKLAIFQTTCFLIVGCTTLAITGHTQLLWVFVPALVIAATLSVYAIRRMV